MERVKFKEKAKKLIQGNKWYIWKPLVIFSLLAGLVTGIASFITGVAQLEKNTVDIIASIVNFVVSICSSVFAVGYTKYVLDFARGKKYDWKEVFNYSKNNFGKILILTILVDLIVTCGTILLIIPGIIASIGLSFYQEVCVDNEDLKVTEIIKKSWNMTKGYKLDIFVLGLSFLGWIILGMFTFGILYIWLIPYMEVTYVIAYDALRKKSK